MAVENKGYEVEMVSRTDGKLTIKFGGRFLWFGSSAEDNLLALSVGDRVRMVEVESPASHEPKFRLETVQEQTAEQ